MTKILFLDIDGTIADNSERLIIAHKAGPPKTPEWLKAMGNPDLIYKDIPYPGAPEAVQKAVVAGFAVFYITHRKVPEAAITIKWLADNGFPRPDGITACASFAADKPKIIKTEADRADPESILIFVDNDPHQIAKVIHLSPAVVCITLPHTASGLGSAKHDFWKHVRFW